jgi:hypothetical protein
MVRIYWSQVLPLPGAGTRHAKRGQVPLFRAPERLFAAGRVNGLAAPDAWLSHAMSKSHHFGPFYGDARCKFTPLGQDHLDTLHCAAKLANGLRALAIRYSITGLLPRRGQTSEGIEKG